MKHTGRYAKQVLVSFFPAVHLQTSEAIKTEEGRDGGVMQVLGITDNWKCGHDSRKPPLNCYEPRGRAYRTMIS